MTKYELVAFIIGFPTTAASTVALFGLWLKHRRDGHRGLSSDAEARLARIENAVETIAVEVERISEAQRFSAKLMAEGRPAAGALPEADYQGGRSRG